MTRRSGLRERRIARGRLYGKPLAFGVATSWILIGVIVLTIIVLLWMAVDG